MNCIPGALILAVTLSGLETSAHFTEVWYREVILGDVRGAAIDYENVYTQRPPFQGSSDDERRSAALRAGLCFEKIGQVAEARLAYDWVRQHGLHGSPIVSVAQARLEEIARVGSVMGPEPPDGTALRGAVSLVRGRLADYIKDTSQEVEKGETELKNLENRLSRLSLRLEAARRLRERLRRRGAAVFVSLTPIAAGSSRGAGELDVARLETLLRAELREGIVLEEVLPQVADGFYRSALRAASARDIATAKRNVEQALALSGGRTAARDFAQRLDSWQDSLAELSSRYLLEERLRQIGELQGRIRERLVLAVLAGQARRDAGVERVVDIWRLVGGALPEVRREAAISHLLREADRLFLALTVGVASRSDPGPPGEQLRRYLAKRRNQIDKARGLVRDIVEVTTELVAMGITTGDEDQRAGTISIVEDELQRLLARGRSRLRAGAVKECSEAIRDAELLVSWFQSLEADYRGPTLRLQQALEDSLRKEPDSRQ